MGKEKGTQGKGKEWIEIEENVPRNIIFLVKASTTGP